MTKRCINFFDTQLLRTTSFFIIERVGWIGSNGPETFLDWIRGVKTEFYNEFRYKIVLKSPEKRNFEIFAQASVPKDELHHWSTTEEEEEEFGNKIHVYGKTMIGQDDTITMYFGALTDDWEHKWKRRPRMRSFPKIPITWTIIQH